MLSFMNRRVFSRKLDRHIVRRASSSKDSFGLDRVQKPAVPDVVRKPPRLPFLKTIYAGQYDIEVLTYPETLNLERHKDLVSRVQQVQHNCTKMGNVRQLGLFGMTVPYYNSGLNLTDTEIARVFEHFDYNTFKPVYEHTLGVDIIKTFGSPNQKAKYLPLLASGAVCSLHDNAVKAKMLPNGSWELDGTINDSECVYLLFVVGDKGYIVEKDKMSISGGKLILNQVVVSPEDVLDNVDVTKTMCRGKLYTCSLLTGSLKKVLQSTIVKVLPKTRLNMKLREYDSVLKTVSRSLINIYVIESMIYLTTWMTDGFDDPDIELETAAVQHLARQTVGTTLAELKMLYGRNAIEEKFSTLCNDVENILDNLEGSIELANFISSRGVEFLNKSSYKDNVSFLTSMYRNLMLKRDDPVLKYGLRQYLHPALMFCADFLERCVLKFQFIIEQNHAAGQLNSENQMLMERLSLIIVHIYAMTAVLGRASRSYCTGIRFCDYEMNAAETVIRESYEFLKPILNELATGEYVVIDSAYESFADELLANNDSIVKEQTKT